MNTHHFGRLFGATALGAVLAVGITVAGTDAAHAAIQQVDPALFTPFPPQTDPAGAGVYGIELRGARDVVARDWQIGVGRGTSQSGNFSNGNIDWGVTTAPTTYAFTFTYGSTGIVGTIGSTSVDWTSTENGGPINQGNAFQIFTKGKSTVTIETVDGVDITDIVLGKLDGTQPESIVFLATANEFADGFTVTGKLQIVKGGGSANGISLKGGTAVPGPAALPLMLGALAGLGIVARRRAKAAA